MIPIKKILILFSLSLLLLTSTAFAEYKYIYSEFEEAAYFDTQTIKLVESDRELYIEVWIKHVFTPDGAKNYIQGRKEDGSTTKGFENFSYYIDHKYYRSGGWNCWIDSIDYAKDGSILDRKDYPIRKWKKPFAGSAGELIYLSIMEYVIENDFVLRSRM